MQTGLERRISIMPYWLLLITIISTSINLKIPQSGLFTSILIMIIAIGRLNDIGWSRFLVYFPVTIIAIALFADIFTDISFFNRGRIAEPVFTILLLLGIFLGFFRRDSNFFRRQKFNFNIRKKQKHSPPARPPR